MEYETFGSPDHPPLLLIIGLGGQMIEWPDDFCRMLAEADLYVIRFDNRDAGLSTSIEGYGPGKIDSEYTAAMRGDSYTPPYTLSDMAADTVGLMDGLGLESAHLCGSSMGGMIAQTAALEFPARVRSLISIMSHNGGLDRLADIPDEEARQHLFTPAPSDREGWIDFYVEGSRLMNGRYEFDEEECRRLAGRLYDRAYKPEGVARQLLAIMASPDRTEGLRELDAPTLVIHGGADPLIPAEAGRETAAAVPGADLLIMDDLGHSLPRPAWSEMAGAIAGHVKKAESMRG
jgi:pimeloyl-ACP methyl ester carboxylesterase